MRTDKDKAFALRRSGKSYSEIQWKLGVPKSTLSDWLRDVEWSEGLKKHLAKDAVEKGRITLRKLDRVRGVYLARVYAEAREEAKREFEHFKFYPLFIAGMAVYWGEGDKLTKHIIRIANTDPGMIRVFLKFLVDVCGIARDRIRASLLLYPDLDDLECKKFWIKATNLHEGNFNKSVVIRGRHKTRRLQYGVCNITISSAYLKEKMMIWLSLLPRALCASRSKLFAGVV